jgi:hypothetical protein
MDNQVIRITVEEADRYATDYFINICGFRNREGEKFKRMMDHGMRIREQIADRIDMRAIVSSYDGGVMSGNTARLGDVAFVCNAFEQLNQDSVLKLYAYLFTAGVFELSDDDPVIDQLYADIWGTAYTDAGLEVLKERLKGDYDAEASGGEAHILNAFGPGYYGMDVDQIGAFFEVLDGGKIGVKARTNSLMLPLKSCAGFHVIVGDNTRLPSADCESCRSDHSGCEFCQAVIRK